MKANELTWISSKKVCWAWDSYPNPCECSNWSTMMPTKGSNIHNVTGNIGQRNRYSCPIIFNTEMISNYDAVRLSWRSPSKNGSNICFIINHSQVWDSSWPLNEKKSTKVITSNSTIGVERLTAKLQNSPNGNFSNSQISMSHTDFDNYWELFN